MIDDVVAGRVWIIHAQSESVGYAILTFGYSLEYQGRDAFIDELYIRAPFRGRGCARQAIALVEMEARHQNVQALHLEVERENTAAQGLYRSLGYADHGRYLMTKRLSQKGT